MQITPTKLPSDLPARETIDFVLMHGIEKPLKTNQTAAPAILIQKALKTIAHDNAVARSMLA